MRFEFLLPLQFFADGAPAGDGGEGGNTAEGAAIAEQQGESLESLGIPKAKMERYNRARMARGAAEEAKAAAEQPNEEVTPTQERKVTFEELLKDPEENAKVQRMVKERLKKANSELERRRMFDESLKIAAAKAGLKDFSIENGDPKALLEAMEKDPSYFEDEAFASGKSTEELMAEKKKARVSKEQSAMQARAHYNSLRNQAEELKKKYPEFDLEKELSNSEFFNMTSLAGGVSVEKAYHAVHFEELMAQRENAAAQKAAASLSKSVSAGSRRAVENGTSGRLSEPMPDKLYSQMSPEERADFYLRTTGRKLSRR